MNHYLKDMLSAIINDDQQSASSHLHNYLVAKTKQMTMNESMSLMESKFPSSREEVEATLKLFRIKNYTINGDLTVDVKENVSLINEDLDYIPLKFRKVHGNFECQENNLTSLIGSPEIVIGHFNCADNNLTSLEGAPREVGGSFVCQINNLTSLMGAPKKVDGDFDCRRNPRLRSLNGIGIIDGKIKTDLDDDDEDDE